MRDLCARLVLAQILLALCFEAFEAVGVRRDLRNVAIEIMELTRGLREREASLHI